MNTPEQFNAAWLAAQPPEVQLLVHTTPVGDARTAALNSLSARFALDPQILQLGEPAYMVMWARIKYGFTWVPAIGQPPIQLFPGQFIPGEVPYNPMAPPTGSIKVVDPDNCNLAVEYPPAVPPPPPPLPPPAPAGPFVGAEWPEVSVLIGKVAYHALNGFSDGIADGAEVTQDGKTWVKGRYWTFATTLPYYTLKV